MKSVFIETQLFSSFLTFEGKQIWDGFPLNKWLWWCKIWFAMTAGTWFIVFFYFEFTGECWTSLNINRKTSITSAAKFCQLKSDNDDEYFCWWCVYMGLTKLTYRLWVSNWKYRICNITWLAFCLVTFKIVSKCWIFVICAF